jgi:hypothetical protein
MEAMTSRGELLDNKDIKDEFDVLQGLPIKAFASSKAVHCRGEQIRENDGI